MERLARTDITLSPRLGWRRYSPWLLEPSDQLPRWAEAAVDLYRATLEEANATVAIDTSKGTARAWWLLRSGAAELRFQAWPFHSQNGPVVAAGPASSGPARVSCRGQRRSGPADLL